LACLGPRLWSSSTVGRSPWRARRQGHHCGDAPARPVNDSGRMTPHVRHTFVTLSSHRCYGSLIPMTHSSFMVWMMPLAHEPELCEARVAGYGRPSLLPTSAPAGGKETYLCSTGPRGRPSQGAGGAAAAQKPSRCLARHGQHNNVPSGVRTPHAAHAPEACKAPKVATASAPTRVQHIPA
jgi:hypothetical protein